MATIVQIKALPRETASKVHELVNVTGQGERYKKLERTKINDKCTDSICALPSKSLGRLLTGLMEEVSNPYYHEDGEPEPRLPEDFMDILNKKKVTRQTLLEIKHGVPRDYYTSRRPRRGEKQKDFTFMQQFRFKLRDGSIFLNLDIPEEELAYYVALESRFVANSMEDWRAHKWPKATHVIIHEGETESEQYKREKAKADALSAINSLDPLTQKKLMKILGRGKGFITETQAFLGLKSFIEKERGDKLDKNIEKLNTYLNLLKNKTGKEEFEARALLEDLLHYRIVFERAGTYTWPAGGDSDDKAILGYRKEEAVQFLLDPKKQPEKDMLKKQLQVKIEA